VNTAVPPLLPCRCGKASYRQRERTANIDLDKHSASFSPYLSTSTLSPLLSLSHPLTLVSTHRAASFLRSGSQQICESCRPVKEMLICVLERWNRVYTTSSMWTIINYIIIFRQICCLTRRLTSEGNNDMNTLPLITFQPISETCLQHLKTIRRL
jgi:hypothetical protein